MASSTLLDDQGTKRTLYEELGVAEYWIVNVHRAEVIAYAIANQGSQRIQDSQVLPGLEIALLNEALRRSRETNQAQVGTWLLQRLQSGPNKSAE